MSRLGSAPIEEVKPRNNVYTVLAAIALIVQIIGFILLYVRYSEILGKGTGLFS
jgi:hypothetical protein